MKITEKIRQLREERQMPQRKFASALLQTDKDELLALWLADQVSAVVRDEQTMADKALNIAKQNINKIKWKTLQEITPLPILKGQQTKP